MEIKFDLKQIKIVEIDQVRPNTWNPKDENSENYSKIKQSIKLKGQRLPIIVRENKGYEIIDGEQRFKACKELEFKKILIYDEGKISDKDAKELTIWYQQQVEFDEIKLAELIKDLTQYPDLELPYTQEQIDEYKKLLEFDWNQYKAEKNIEYDKEERALSIKCSQTEFTNIKNAINQVVKKENISEGKALELICNDYLAGVKSESDTTRQK